MIPGAWLTASEPWTSWEQRGILFIVALNSFDGVQRHEVEDVRTALQLGSEVPFFVTDARERDSVKNVLVGLVEHAMAVVRRG